MIGLSELAARGEALAIVSGEYAWSYAELASRAGELASRLARAGVRRGDVVALALGRDPHHIAAMLAAWELGAAFLPLDPAAPAARASAMVREARARVLLRMDASRVQIDALQAEGALGDEDLAYVIYTSGSTGRPKGVRVSHRGLWCVLDEQARVFGLDASKRALVGLSLAFDASISDIGTALVSGAAMVLLPRPISPHGLVETLDALRVTHADLPPSILPWADVARLPSSLEVVIVGGEPASPPAVRAWASRTRVINVYGPTEATICTHLCECTTAWTTSLVGAPMAHVKERLVDEELWLAGPALALGYVDRPELEAARFVERDGERWYKTGDRVRHNGDGTLEFRGRLDRQLKVRGLLVAPEEIEARLMEINGVASALVTERGDVLVASIEPLDPTLDVSIVRAALGNSLPDWMMPSIELTSALRRGPTGKVSTTARASPRVEAIIGAFRDVLLTDADAYSDFFSLGGHSLAALEVAARASLHGVHVTPDAVLTARTPLAISNHEPYAPTFEDLDARGLDLFDELEPAESSGEGQEWLITGATGFLGALALAEIQLKTDARVNVLVRARDDAHARDRLASIDDVTVWAGDVSQRNFGLGEARWRELASRVGRVLHCAAIVNMALPLESLAANVRGAVEVARFARTGASKVVTHVSSLAVLVQTDDESTVVSESTRLMPLARVFGGYAQSKVIAESVLRRAGARIVRPGLLTGDSTTGKSARTCSLAWTLRSLARVGCVPEGDHDRLRADLTPIDFAGRVIGELAVSDACADVVHVSSARGASLRQLIAALREHVSIDVVSKEEWIGRTRNALPRDAALALLSIAHRLLGVERHRDVDLFLLTDRTFRSKRVAPVADAALLDRYVRHALAETA